MLQRCQLRRLRQRHVGGRSACSRGVPASRVRGRGRQLGHWCPGSTLRNRRTVRGGTAFEEAASKEGEWSRERDDEQPCWYWLLAAARFARASLSAPSRPPLSARRRRAARCDHVRSGVASRTCTAVKTSLATCAAGAGASTWSLHLWSFTVWVAALPAGAAGTPVASYTVRRAQFAPCSVGERLLVMSSLAKNSCFVTAICAFILAQSLKVLTHRRANAALRGGACPRRRRPLSAHRLVLTPFYLSPQSQRRQMGRAPARHLRRDAVLTFCAGKRRTCRADETLSLANTSACSLC